MSFIFYLLCLFKRREIKRLNRLSLPKSLILCNEMCLAFFMFRSNVRKVFLNNQPFHFQYPVVAVKSIKETNESALNEVEVLKRLNHDGITKYLTSFFDVNDGGLHIVMEYCEVGDLAYHIKRKQ